MAATSTMLPLGTKAPDFSLRNAVDGRGFSLDDFDGKKALLVMFICNHCPYVQHVRAELARLGKDYLPKDVGIVAINSNDVSAYPQDGPEHMRAMAIEDGWEFPFLYDERQEVAKAYRAACTPDLFLFDGDSKLVYRGQLDDSRPGKPTPLTGRDLRAALDAALAGKKVPQEQRPSVGCSIKWKPGNEPQD